MREREIHRDGDRQRKMKRDKEKKRGGEKRQKRRESTRARERETETEVEIEIYTYTLYISLIARSERDRNSNTVLPLFFCLYTAFPLFLQPFLHVYLSPEAHQFDQMHKTALLQCVAVCCRICTFRLKHANSAWCTGIRLHMM